VVVGRREERGASARMLPPSTLCYLITEALIDLSRSSSTRNNNIINLLINISRWLRQSVEYLHLLGSTFRPSRTRLIHHPCAHLRTKTQACPPRHDLQSDFQSRNLQRDLRSGGRLELHKRHLALPWSLWRAVLLISHSDSMPQVGDVESQHFLVLATRFAPEFVEVC